MPTTGTGYIPGTVPDKCGPCDCRCSCCCDDQKGISPHPIRYANGEIQLSATDLHSEGFGVEWGHTRTYSNRLNVDTDFGNGFDWLIGQLPYLTHDPDGSIAVVFSSTVAYWFDQSGSSYVPRYGAKQTLTLGDGYFTLTFPDGEVWQFYDLSYTYLHGKFAAMYPPGAAPRPPPPPTTTSSAIFFT
jgi:hypothetical protein